LPFFACASFKNMVATLACKKCNVRRFALHLFAFFQAGAVRAFFICSFALMQKNEKIKAKRMLRRLAGHAHEHPAR